MTDRVLADVLDSPCRKLDAYKPQKNDAWGVIGSQLTLGEYLCNLLLNQMSMFHVAVPGRKVVVSSLATLFVISNSSKLKAIDSGFLEAVIEDMKDIHVKLNLASLQINRDENQNKKVWQSAALLLMPPPPPVVFALIQCSVICTCQRSILSVFPLTYACSILYADFIPVVIFLSSLTVFYVNSNLLVQFLTYFRPAFTTYLMPLALQYPL